MANVNSNPSIADKIRLDATLLFSGKYCLKLPTAPTMLERNKLSRIVLSGNYNLRQFT